MQERARIVPVNIEKQMKSAYIDYSMSVIVSRALPDVRDGFKPVHRRIMYAMWDTKILSSSPTKKSARIVGEVLGKYHPHGDTAVYDAMVRMAQDWSLRYTLVDGQGNFGSIDGDGPAAMRYTEARMKKIAEEMLVDIDKETVDFQNNFDDSLKEPTVLPAKIPNLLINGSSGIAVGMATNMPPHNLSEIIDGIIAYIDNKEISIEGLMKYIKAPDFPTGCTIYGYDGVKDAYHTGKGRILMRGDVMTEIVDHSHGKERLVIQTIPYQVNKSDMVRKIADLVKDGKIEGIAEIRDESKKEIRIVLELKRDAVSNVIINKLYQFSPLQTSFSVNNVALVNGRPLTLNLKDLIHYFVEHRHEVVIRRSKYDLRKAQERAHILEGLLKALDIIDEIIQHIRASMSVEEARNGLVEKWAFSELQAAAIVEMRLRQLVGLEKEKLQKEYDELQERIDYLTRLLADEDMRMEVIKEELLEIKEKYGDEPKSNIEYTASDFRIEDTISDEDVIITISHMGYIKRTSLREYKVQNRGGKGSRGSDARETDFIEHLYTATNHNYLLFFTEKGRCYWLRVFEIPEGSKTSKGRAIQNLINIEADDKVKAVINVTNLTDQEYINNNYIILCTEKGTIKKTTLKAYSRPRQNGINAIIIRDGDNLLEAKLTDGNSIIMMALHSGKAIRFDEKKVRPTGRIAAGVKGITLANSNDKVIGMICVNQNNGNKADDILVVSENGFGKRSSLDDYRETNRGGKGVITINITPKTGNLIAIKNVNDQDDLMIINRSGIIIRMKVADLRVVGRATQGVKLINLNEDDVIAAVTQVPSEDEKETEDINQEQDNTVENNNNDN
ncbi:MAG: DNA gyrase subunit A [Bacteroidales bacterium]|jgi:DNA gyrase subunit A|nr:DNA gyrase subunit A [Bacteroidales bacterium]MDD2686844.1 DNA gyrase subunit A [Bacteroidales bacterium]MDD3329860.1 DNA gyrase subunit A [Bacteroidales bacterium]MDD3690724.1 DNA gyrase subunit A [Bacteroidales bacterium]MDD4043993.1 DNA gyrase subunit A [Bacteroidales bacterium]